MTCHSSNCSSIVWGQGNGPLVTSLRPNLESAQIYISPEFMWRHDNVEKTMISRVRLFVYLLTKLEYPAFLPRECY